MPRKKSYLTVTDQFCGAGGSSQGVRMLSDQMGGGLEVKIALNHWKLAIETHNTNFPDTLHDCTDISACDPRRYFSTDILITSPECTNHTLAKGQRQVKKQLDLFESGRLDPAAERSRATMWDVPRFAEYHRYRIIITENVVEAYKWVLYGAWIKAMTDLGYYHQPLFLNSMFFPPTPQSRDRMYVVFWQKSLKAPDLIHRPPAYCEKCGDNVSAIQVWKNPALKWGKYKQQYNYHCPVHGNIVQPYYYAAFNVIDWSDLGIRIGDRLKPLAPNTKTRILHGLDKYGDEPLIITSGYSSGVECRVKPAANELATQPGDARHGILTPFLVDDKQTTGFGNRVRKTTNAINTIHTDPRVKLITPFIIKTEYSGKVSSAKDEMHTQTTRQTSALISPMIVKLEHTKSGAKNNIKKATDPLQVQTTAQSVGIVTPIIIKNFSGDPKSKSKKVDKPLGAITTADHHALLTPFIVENKKQSKSRSSLDPLSTETTKLYQGIITDESWKAFLSYNYNGLQVSNITDPAGTVTTKDRMSLVSYQKPKYEDCYYRMLKPHEIKLGMAFEHDYIILGSGRDQVKQCGNAVTPPVMQWIIAKCIEVLK